MKPLFRCLILAVVAAGSFASTDDPGLGPGEQIHLAWVEDPATTMTVVWRTLATGVESAVQYRRAGGSSWRTAIGGVRPATTAGELHEVTLRRLSPGTRYEYRVRLAAGWSEVHSCWTAPPPGPATYEFVFVADTGLAGRKDGLGTGVKELLEELGKLNPLLVLLGGDYAYYDTDKRFGSLYDSIDAWFSQMMPISVKAPMMPTYGNHEVYLQEQYLDWAERFPTPEGFDNRRYYSFRVGDVHFVSILAALTEAWSPRDGFRGLPAAAMRWIEQDLAAARKSGVRWIIPFLHVAPFSDGSNHPSNLDLRAQLGPLFEQYGVKIVLTSHDQSYERTYPLRGVPSQITVTSRSLSCYTMSDGVTWLKVSPGGKESNINRGFATFKTGPPPFWTAFRDNTRHHFARLFVSPQGLRVEIVGVKAGEPTAVQDSFAYVLGKCPDN